MFSFFRKKASPVKNTAPQITESELNLDDLFKEEIQKCPFIKPEAHETVLAHLKGTINLNKTPDKLSADEKRELGLNPRQAITQSLIDVLQPEGLKTEYPKAILKILYLRATSRKYIEDTLVRFRSLDLIKEFELSDCADERDCLWCKSMNGKKMPLDTDLSTLIENNCKCESHCRLVILPIVDL